METKGGCLGCLGKAVHHTCGREPDAYKQEAFEQIETADIEVIVAICTTTKLRVQDCDCKDCKDLREFGDKVEGNLTRKGEIMQYTCPECGMVGAHRQSLPAPKCHRCNYEVVMKPSKQVKRVEITVRYVLIAGECVFQFYIDREMREALGNDGGFPRPRFLNIGFDSPIAGTGLQLFREQVCYIVAALTLLPIQEVELRGYRFIKMLNLGHEDVVVLASPAPLASPGYSEVSVVETDPGEDFPFREGVECGR